jgi:signal transduction histidine kinase/HAMP domain-containing protein
MSNPLDLNIGQRLAIGFGAVMLVVAFALALVFQWHAQSVRSEATYTGRIVPLIDRALALERSVFRTAIDLRSFALNPDADSLGRFRASAAAVRAASSALDRAEMEADGRDLYAPIAIAADEYVRFADDVARQNPQEMAPAEESGLNARRERLFLAMAEFIALQERKAESALAQIAEGRARTSQGLAAMAALVALILLIVAGLTTRSVSRPTRSLLETANALTAGDWKPALRLAPVGDRPQKLPRNELARLALAFGCAAVSLEQRERRLEADGEVAKAVGATLNRERLCDAALQHVVRHLSAEIGVIYCARNGTTLEPIAQYALGTNLPPVPIGDGIPGQAARDRKLILVNSIPADSGFEVRLGFDRVAPRCVAAVPLTFQGNLLGVLVVGALRDLGPDAAAFLESSAVQIGVGLQNVGSHEETQRLLDDVRESNERIQAQNEELQLQNEEIQAQNEEIQAQTEELQAQNEEIQAQNEELLQQGEELRRHAASLAEADAQKNRFLGILAHELRNPMTPIANSIHILNRIAPGSDGARQAQAIIERQVSHLVRLVDDLLDITRISEGKIQVVREPLDLTAELRACAEDLAADFEQRGVTLSIDVPDEPVQIHGDRTRLSQVLGNLLNNGMKFADRGNVSVSLRVDHGNGDAVLRVIDDGAGIDPELLPKLFQPFIQGDTGPARVKGGLGLGLALVKALVALHDGEVVAHSDGRGRGAQFTVRLPLASPRTPSHERAPKTTAPSPPAAVKRVLIIEDNADAATTLREALAFEGYQVEIADTGSAGLAILGTFCPDVVLCDIGLPDLDGYEIARRVRADPVARSVLLIALTGYASAVDKENARAAGFDLHVAKPLSIPRFGELLAGIKRPD